MLIVLFAFILSKIKVEVQAENSNYGVAEHVWTIELLVEKGAFFYRMIEKEGHF